VRDGRGNPNEGAPDDPITPSSTIGYGGQVRSALVGLPLKRRHVHVLNRPGQGTDERKMGEATVVRWRRYGKDRLYVTASDEAKIGWHDLLTGEDHVDVAEHADAYRAAVAAWKGGDTIPATVAAAVPAVSVADEVAGIAETAPHAEPDWKDLSARRAGALAREQAVALKQAAPVRTFIARALGVHTDERAWRIGADGEEKVAAQLVKLEGKDRRWRFLHAVPIGQNGSDIDHVVIGPGGVFTLNAKHHPGGKIWVGGNTFLVNGVNQPYIRNSRFEATRAAKLLTAACGFPVSVMGVVVPVGADELNVKTQPADVYVVNRMRLVNWFSGLPLVLDDACVETIFEAARRSTIWQPKR